MIEYRDILEKLLDLAKQEFDEAEVFFETSTSVGISYYNKDLDEYEISDVVGLSLTVRQGNKWANTYSERVSEEALPEIVQAARQALEVSEEDVYRRLYKPEADETVPTTEQSTLEITVEDMLKLASDMAEMTLAKSDEVQMVSSSSSSYSGKTIIMNTLGLDKETNYRFAFIINYVVLSRSGEMKSAMAFERIKDGLPNIERVVDESIQEASETYGAKSMKSSKQKIVLRRDVASSLMRAFSSVFSADNVQKGLSLMAGKRGQAIANSSVNLVDDPMNPNGLVQSPFDGEGVNTEKLYLVRNGVLENYLYDISTAAKDESERKGNAKRSYKGKASPGLSTFVLEAGEKSFDELLETVGEGLLITDLQGLHSGLDDISGDFSLPANGFLIEGGKKTTALNQITIAGNLMDLLMQIEEVGADAELSLNGAYFPSLIISDVSISGEE